MPLNGFNLLIIDSDDFKRVSIQVEFIKITLKPVSVGIYSFLIDLNGLY